MHWSNLGNFEGARQEDTFYVILRWQLLLVAMSGKDIDALVVPGLGDLGHLRHLRQRRLLAEATVIDGAWPADVVPGDLLDVVIELVGMAVLVIDIAVPVAAWHVTPDALDGHITFLEVVKRVHDLFEATHLPGDLIDGHLGAKFPIWAQSHHVLIKEHKGVV